MHVGLLGLLAGACVSSAPAEDVHGLGELWSAAGESCPDETRFAVGLDCQPGLRTRVSCCLDADSDLHGPRVEWHSSGAMIERRQYERGLRHGSHAEWSRDGSLIQSGQFEEDIRSGTWKRYDDGLLRSSGEYRTVELAGGTYIPRRIPWQWFRADGLVDEQAVVWDTPWWLGPDPCPGDAELVGLVAADGPKRWDQSPENGSIHCRDDKGRQGRHARFEKNGRWEDTHFVDDVESGLRTLWGGGGTRLSEGEMHDGRRHGEWTFLHLNQTVYATGRYLRGVPVGEWSWFNDAGERMPHTDRPPADLVSVTLYSADGRLPPSP